MLGGRLKNPHLLFDRIGLGVIEHKEFRALCDALFIAEPRTETHEDKEVLCKHVKIEKGIIARAAHCKHDRRHDEDRFEWEIGFHSSSPK